MEDEVICACCGGAEWIEDPNTEYWICLTCEAVITAPPLED